MAVEVTFAEGDIVSIVPLPDSELAREQADLALATAKLKGSQLAGGLVARFGLPKLAGMAALVAGRFILNTLSVNIGPSFRGGLSFWKLLAVINSPAGMIDGLRERQRLRRVRPAGGDSAAGAELVERG